MIRMKSATAAVAAMTMMLAACSSDSSGRDALLLDVGKRAVSNVKTIGKRPKGPPPPVSVTKEQLQNTKVPALLVNNVTRGGGNVLRLATRRTDANPGTIAVWGGNGAAQVVLRNGVLVGTRGIGNDLISADATATIRAINGARSGNGQRRYFISDGSYGQVELVLSCDITSLGRATTQVVHLQYATVHLRETCIGGAGDRVRIDNEYWVQPGSDIVRRSRQWAGPESGYFDLTLLRN